MNSLNIAVHGELTTYGKKSNNKEKKNRNKEINTIILYVEDRTESPRKLIIVREMISITSPEGIVRIITLHTSLALSVR